MSLLFPDAGAFDPFFTERIVYEGARGEGRRVYGTFRACLFDGGFEDPLMDDGTSSSRRLLVAHIARHGDDAWPDDGTSPQIGDDITLETGVRFRVFKVGLSSVDAFVVEAREA